MLPRRIARSLHETRLIICIDYVLVVDDLNKCYNFDYNFLWLLNLYAIYVIFVCGSLGLRLLVTLSFRSSSLSLAQFMALVVFCLVMLWLGCKVSL